MPSCCHSPSSSHAPPNGRESVNASPGTPTTRARSGPGPVAGSTPSSRVNEAISRSIAVRSSSSARPREYSTLVREDFAAGSHSLWASCR